ncbi:hypothetical protein DES44_0852 [Roseateles depolymerans]|uniref:Uncharacterized protein n=1 Tax=Roseateles depolymerans TaxID=76731 RepID=A0A0U3D363_9BURK|nr:hypothetical protein RD2015_3598 [Roseateles depolymerans]REG21725.1 hypothetical protein DES44_0852 [Roseateles depolymerans]
MAAWLHSDAGIVAARACLRIRRDAYSVTGLLPLWMSVANNATSVTVTRLGGAAAPGGNRPEPRQDRPFLPWLSI